MAEGEELEAGASRPKPSLRDHLVRSLSTLPNPIPLRLTVVSSTPKRTSSLFPYAVAPPRCLEKEYLVLLSCTRSGSLPSDTTSHQPQGESSTLSSSLAPTPSTTEEILAVGIHAYVHTLPALGKSILYISKVDTSGYADTPLPLARCLVTSFLDFHLDPLTRPSPHVQIALFARSQSQYLFPNSAKAEGKRVSGGLRLCGWWKAVYEQVAVKLTAALRGTETETETSPGRVEMRYLLPSYSEEEARGMLGASKVVLPEGTTWTYRPPFPENLFVSSGSTGSTTSVGSCADRPDARLAWSIPCLSDDPKTRFLEELVVQSTSLAGSSSATISSDETSSSAVAAVDKDDKDDDRQVQSSSNDVKDSSEKARQRAHGKKDKYEAERSKSQAALDRIGLAEFWERMGFRQECASGDVTGFFHLDSRIEASRTHDPGQTKGDSIRSHSDATDSAALEGAGGAVRNIIFDRIHQSLLNCDFGSRHLAEEGSEIWLKSTEGLVKDELGQAGWDDSTAIVAAKENAVAAGVKRKDEGVNMLQIKKKPKKARPNVS